MLGAPILPHVPSGGSLSTRNTRISDRGIPYRQICNCLPQYFLSSTLNPSVCFLHFPRTIQCLFSVVSSPLCTIDLYESSSASQGMSVLSYTLLPEICEIVHPGYHFPLLSLHPKTTFLPRFRNVEPNYLYIVDDHIPTRQEELLPSFGVEELNFVPFP